MRMGVVIGAALCLTSCASTPKPVAPTPQVVCPALKTYTDPERVALARALQPIPPDSPIIAVIGDYAALRKAVQACHAH